MRGATKASSDNPIFYVPSPFDFCTFHGTFPRRQLFQGFSFPIGMPRQCQDKLSEASLRGKTRRITFATMRVCRSFLYLKMFNDKDDENIGQRKKFNRLNPSEILLHLSLAHYDKSMQIYSFIS